MKFKPVIWILFFTHQRASSSRCFVSPRSVVCHCVSLSSLDWCFFGSYLQVNIKKIWAVCHTQKGSHSFDLQWLLAAVQCLFSCNLLYQVCWTAKSFLQALWSAGCSWIIKALMDIIPIYSKTLYIKHTTNHFGWKWPIKSSSPITTWQGPGINHTSPHLHVS